MFEDLVVFYLNLWKEKNLYKHSFKIVHENSEPITEQFSKKLIDDVIHKHDKNTDFRLELEMI
jgi:hypothetical protein